MKSISLLSKTVVGVLSLLLPLAMAGAPIPKLFNTGVDDAGALLADSVMDSHYFITLSPDASYPGPASFTLQPGFPVGPWISEGPSSRWIAPQPNQAAGNAGGTYTYATTFDLTGLDPASAQISGRLATDDSLVGVRLNGTPLTGITSAGFTTFSSFTIPVGSSFIVGTNTLEFDVNNGGPNPTGFRVEMSGRANGANEAPTVITPPASQTVLVGDQVSFTVDASGTPPFSYQWRFNGAPIPAATNISFTIIAARTNDAGLYSVVVTNLAGSATSANATLTVLTPFPGIYNTGVNSNRVTLQDGEIDPHYTLILNPNDPPSSEAYAQITIPSPPWVTNSPQSRWIGPFTDSVGAQGSYSYQLLLNLTGYNPASAFLQGRWATDDGGSLFLNGADTGFRSPSFTAFSQFSLTNGFVTGTNVLEFRIQNGGLNPTGLRVENLVGTAQPQTVSNLPPRIVIEPVGGTRVITDNFSFTVVADGTQPLSYQWFTYSNQVSTPLPGKTNATLTLSPVLSGSAGDYYVRVSNAFGSLNSILAYFLVVEPELGIFNTGVGANGAALPAGQPDPHYVLITSPDATYPGPSTFANAHPAWFANDADSGWISARVGGDGTIAPGIYRYRLIFRVDNSNDVATAAITGNFGTDDGNGGVFLNGSPISVGASGFGSLTLLDIPAGSPFVTGLNTLDFLVNNAGAAANPSGLRVDNLTLTGVTFRPRLTISKANNLVQITWPASASDFVLQEAPSLNGTWTNSADQGAIQGDLKSVSISPAGAMKFYRLRK